MRNKTFLLLLVLVGLTLTAACQRSKKRVIAVIPKGTAHLFWVSVHEGADDAGKQFGVDILWNGPAVETDFGRQLEILDSMINRRVDGIVVAASDKKVLNQSLKRAKELGIPVTVFDSGVDSDDYVSFVATNNFEAGQMGARKLAELLNGKGKIAIVMNAPGSASTMDRERGFTETIEKEFPGISIVGTQFGMSDRAKAMAVAENLLTAHPDLNGMFSSSEPMTVGTSQALKAHGMAGKIKFVGFDSSEGLIDDMKAGVIDALVVQDPHKIGFEAVKTIVDKLNGKTPPHRMDLGAKVITKANT
ncbi:MAG TPA: substrate-binding domain-containing protein [Bryobacteraceae bacterium]